MPESLHLTEPQLNDYLLGRLPDDEHDDVERHLAECPKCAGEAGGIRPRDAFVELLRRAAHSPTIDDVLKTHPLAADSSEVDLPDDEACTAPSSDGVPDVAGVVPPVLLGHPGYRLIRELGRGGMGSVWLAEHLVLDRMVALKMLHADRLAGTGNMDRFHREIRAAAKLNHPHIAAAYNAEQIGDSHVLVMEYVEGRTLAEILQSGPPPIEDACSAVRDAALGLMSAHAANLVHRDIKPGNLIRTPGGIVKILDFGLVTSADTTSALTAPNLVMGTPDYISPEQALNPHTGDARSDIYSLGCTFFHLVTGHVPFPEDSALKKIDARREKEADLSDVPESLRSVIAKMMARDPADRFESAAEVVAAIDRASTESPPISGTLRHATARRMSGRRMRALLVTAVAVFSVAVLLSVNRVTPPDETDVHSPSATADAGAVPPEPVTFAPGSIVPLLVPSSLGSGTPQNYSIRNSDLLVDTLSPGLPEQLWLNFYHLTAQGVRCVCVFRCTELNADSVLKLALLSDDSAEYDFVLLNMTDSSAEVSLIRWAPDGERRVLAETATGGLRGGSEIRLELQVSGTHLSGWINGECVLQAECSEMRKRYPAIAIRYCIAELISPHAVLNTAVPDSELGQRAAFSRQEKLRRHIYRAGSHARNSCRSGRRRYHGRYGHITDMVRPPHWCPAGL
ncbi:MAG: protein kinase [Planctomycetaceae bacterium]|nr:protein kinase [Planctomycetaceae bacterium]